MYDPFVEAYKEVQRILNEDIPNELGASMPHELKIGDQKVMIDNLEIVNQTTIKNEQHESGAIRSGDALGSDYWLITPLGLRELGNAYQKYKRPNVQSIPYHINHFYDNVYDYLAGNRADHFIMNAAIDVCELIVMDAKEELITINSSYTYFNIPPLALRQLAETFTEGKNKYCQYNCELGFPISSLINHAIKHINDYNYKTYVNPDYENNERDLPHALWNLLMIKHSELMWPHLNKDLRGLGCTLTDDIKEYIKRTISGRSKSHNRNDAS